MNLTDLRTEIKRCFQEVLKDPKKPISIESPHDLILLKEACELTNSSKSKIYKLTRLKQIPFQKYGSRLVFSKRELIAWMGGIPINPSMISNSEKVGIQIQKPKSSI